MIFDDHDIRDDWNTSLSWKKKMEATTWWHGPVCAGLASYWVYQHLGNLSPRERAEDAVWQRIIRHEGEDEIDLGAELDKFAERASGTEVLQVELLPRFRGHAADRGGLPRSTGPDAGRPGAG